MIKTLSAFVCISFFSVATFAQTSIDFLCPTSAEVVSVEELGYDVALDTMYSPIRENSVWGVAGSDSSPIVFQDNRGSFKIGYDYRAKECQRQIILEKELGKGLWEGHTIVEVCAPAVAKLFDGARDFESDVWPKLEALSAAISEQAAEKEEEYNRCNEERDKMYDEMSALLAHLQLFKDDVNGDGVVDDNDYEDSNQNGLVDSGDRGVVNGKTFAQVNSEQTALFQRIQQSSNGCFEILDEQFEIERRASSLLGLKMTDEVKDHVQWVSSDDGELLPRFAVPIRRFFYQRKMAWIHSQQEGTGHYLFSDERGMNPVYSSSRGCEMLVEHTTSYGGLAQSYSWDFNYTKPYAAKTWSFNENGISVQDPEDFVNRLENFRFLDFDATDFIEIPRPGKL